MNFSISLLQLLGLSLAPTFVTPQGLNVTAISAINGVSVLECWDLTTPPRSFAGAANYDIGNFENAFVGVIAPRTWIGFAHAPSIQFVSLPKTLQIIQKERPILMESNPVEILIANRFSLVISGLVHIRLPNLTTEAWIQGGKYGFIIAADTIEVSKLGHITEFPGGDDTVIAQFPIAGGVVPEHVVLHEGPCNAGSGIGVAVQKR